MIFDITTNDSKNFSYIDLGNMPYVNNLNSTEEESLSCKKFPLKVCFFEKSELSRLSFIPESEELFDTYLYTSGVNKPYYTHCLNMFNYLNNYLNINDDDLIIDIGGNDGTLLKAFKESHKSEINALNIEPSSVYKISINNHIRTINEYFSEELSKNLNLQAKLIITTNVFQHLFDIVSFTKGIVHTLKDDGIWCLEFPYWKNTIETLQFDQIYHEHIYYYNFTPLFNFFKREGLRVINVTKQNIHSGSLRLLICKDISEYKSDETINKFLLDEKKLTKDFYLDLTKKIKIHVEECKQVLNNLAKDNNIIGFGAAAKGCIFLNYLNIKNDTIKYIIDDTELKQNKYVPGTGIKITNRDILNTEKIDYILILAHNFYEYIIESLKNHGYKGKFIVLLPEIKIL